MKQIPIPLATKEETKSGWTVYTWFLQQIYEGIEAEVNFKEIEEILLWLTKNGYATLQAQGPAWTTEDGAVMAIADMTDKHLVNAWEMRRRQLEEGKPRDGEDIVHAMERWEKDIINLKAEMCRRGLQKGDTTLHKEKSKFEEIRDALIAVDKEIARLQEQGNIGHASGNLLRNLLWDARMANQERNDTQLGDASVAALQKWSGPLSAMMEELRRIHGAMGGTITSAVVDTLEDAQITLRKLAVDHGPDMFNDLSFIKGLYKAEH